MEFIIIHRTSFFRCRTVHFLQVATNFFLLILIFYPLYPRGSELVYLLHRCIVLEVSLYVKCNIETKSKIEIKIYLNNDRTCRPTYILSPIYMYMYIRRCIEKFSSKLIINSDDLSFNEVLVSQTDISVSGYTEFSLRVA